MILNWYVYKMKRNMQRKPKLLAFCMNCGECLGEERPFYAKEHLEKYPDHRSGFLVKAFKEPFGE